ncbi:hypothetical protein LCGC14_1546830, partial [marine sediment metagenome]
EAKKWLETYGKDKSVVPPEVELSEAPPKTTLRNKPPETPGVQAKTGDVEAVPTLIEAKGKPLSEHEVIATLSKTWDVPIRIGRIRQGFKKRPAGIYKPMAEVVRTQGEFAGHLGVVAHEVGHHLDKTTDALKGISDGATGELKNLDYDKKKRRVSEGFPEFMRLYWTDPAKAQAEAPEFFKHFTAFLAANPDVMAKVGQTSGLIKQWQDQGAEARVRAARSTTGKGFLNATPAEKANRAWQLVREVVTDDLVAVDEAMKEASRLGAKFRKGENPYVWMRVMRNAPAPMAWDAVMNGVRSVVTGKKIGPGLREALEGLGDFTVEEFEQFTSFLHARHGLDTWKTGRNPGISEADAQHVYDKYKDKPGWEEAAKAVTRWNKDHIRMLAEAGHISPEAEQRILESLPAYIPLLRVVDSLKQAGQSGVVNVGSLLKSLRGSARQIIDPFTAMFQLSSQMHGAAISTMIGRKLVDIAESVDGMGWIIEGKLAAPTATMRTTVENMKKQLQEAGADLIDADVDAIVSITQASSFYRGGEPIAHITRNGKSEWVQFNPDLFRAVTNMDAIHLPWWINIPMLPFSAFAKGVRLGATTLRAGFAMGTNPIRDIQEVLMKTEGRPWAGLMLIPRTIGYNIRYGLDLITGKNENPVKALYDRYGGVLSTFVGQDIKTARKRTQDLINSVQGRRAHNIIRHPFEAVQRLFSLTEIGPRLAEGQAVLERHGFTKEQLKNDEVPHHVQMEMLLAMNEATVDFSRRGHLLGVLNRYSAFSNVAIQGPSQAIRKTIARPLTTLIRGAALLTLPTLAYWWYVKDEDWYKELPPWRRFFFWNLRIGGQTWSIPRPFEYGIVFAAIPEAIADSWHRSDDKRVKQLAEETWQTQVPGRDVMIPDLLLLERELSSEYGWDTWRGRDVVPKGVQHLEKEDQFSSYNTEVSKRLGKWFGASPAKIDYAIASATGGMGMDILKIPEEGPVRALGFGRFVRPTGTGESVDEFYEKRDQVTRLYNSTKRKGRVPSSLQTEYDRYYEAATKMAAVRKKMAEITKREDRLPFERRITGLARKALGKKALAEYPTR